MSDPANLQAVETAKSQLKLLLDGGKYAEACRYCCQAIKQWPGENVFYRGKAYCELQLSRWHGCLETIGWLHGYIDHPSFHPGSAKRLRKRKAPESGGSSPVTNLQRDTLSAATKTHFEANECMWLHFEQAYCYYKLGKFDLGLQTISSCFNNSTPRNLLDSSPCNKQTPDTIDVSTLPPKFQLLYAQLCMRMGRFEETRRVYSQVTIKGATDLLELNRLSVNLAIAAAENRPIDTSEFCKAINAKIEAGKVEGYEMYYNWACAMIAEGRFEDAMQYIDLAQELLYKELQDEMEDDVSGLQPEFCNILAQYGFLHLHFGNEDMAANFTRQLVEKYDFTEVDQSVLLVALSNALALVKKDPPTAAGSSLLTYYKSIGKLLRKDAVVAKLSKQDLLAIHGNCVWSFMHCGKYKECRIHLQLFKNALLNDLGREGCIDYWVYTAVLSLLEGDVNSCLSILGRARQQLGQGEFRLIATIARVLLSQNRYKDAQSLLSQSYESFVDSAEAFFEFAQTSLETHIGLGSARGVVDVLQKVTDIWQSGTLDMSNVTSNLVKLIKDGCKFLELLGHHSQASKFYRILHSHNHTDDSVVCGILFNDSFKPKSKCISLAEDNTNSKDDASSESASAAIPVEFQVPFTFTEKVQRIIKMIDAEELEQVADLDAYMYPSNLSSSPTFGPHSGGSRNASPRRRRKRRRRSKPAKNTRLAGPDPERWLPKYERMAYKKKKRDFNRNTQGSTASGTSPNRGAANKPSTGTISTEAYVGRRSRVKKRGNR